MKLKLFRLLPVLPTFFLCNFLSAQKVIQERSSLTAYTKDDDGKGVASATVNLDYLVRRMGDEALFSLSYSQITIDAEAGYYYKGKRYGSEVPGLIDLLRKASGSYPRVSFDIYYGPHKQGSFTYQISARNDLGAYSGDFKTFKTTKDKLDKPEWRLVATGLHGFNYSPDPTIWMSFESLITNYEKDKKAKLEYDELIREGDRFFTSQQYKEALPKYFTASNYSIADGYPKSQMAKARELMAKGEKQQNYKAGMEAGRAAENNKEYMTAISYYTTAARLGVNNMEAENNINRVKNIVDDLKRKQEDEIKKKEAEDKRIKKETEDQRLKDKAETDRILKQKEDDIIKKNEEEQEKLKQHLEKEERKKLEEEMKEKWKKEAEEQKKKEEQEEKKEKKERNDRRNYDDKTIARYEENMEYNPELYTRKLAIAEKHYKKANELNPYKALELDKEWWDMNIYMEDFREDLNEPRRQEAWGKSQQLLYEQENEYDLAKYYYMEAIRYADRDSRQHKYLLKRIEWMNKDIDFQKTMIKSSRKGEDVRKKNYEDAKVYKYLARINNNRDKARQTYHILTQDYLYPNLNSKVVGSENALQRQMDFERRLNEADQQLQKDNLVTGITSQVAMSVMLDDSKSAELYGNHSMGLNLFATTGYAGYPIVANEVPMPGYVTRTRADNLTVAPFQGGFDWWIHRSKNWDIGITGDGLIGVLPMMGYKNFFFSYGANFKVNAGVKRIKFAIEADWHSRSGSYEFDQDVALAEMNNPYQQPTDVVFAGEFKYTVIKAGGGLHINFADEYSDGYLRLMYYAEKPSFYTGFDMKKPVTSAGLQVVFRGGITLCFDYAKNYPVAGTAKNFMLSYTDRDYFKLSFGKTWTIAKTK